MKTYRYSIIVPHYDGSINDELFIRGMNCLLNQEDQNFEVLIYHDGPISRPIPDLYKKFGDRCKLTITKKRDNDWGHSNRDKGIREATGEWIVHFNPDNIVYPNLLSEISKIIDTSDKYPSFYNSDGTKKLPSDAIIIFPIHMIGHYKFGLANMAACRIHEHHHQRFILTGDPCVFSNIDCMQVVMKKDLWLKHGGWYDKRSFGDGVMYQKIVSEENGAKYCDKILGEHW